VFGFAARAPASPHPVAAAVQWAEENAVEPWAQGLAREEGAAPDAVTCRDCAVRAGKLAHNERLREARVAMDADRAKDAVAEISFSQQETLSSQRAIGLEIQNARNF